MASYFIGDVQGCDAALGALLRKIDFSPSRDTVFLLGDLVNRGPQSLAVLLRLQALGDTARCLLGNHDLHLLAVAHGVRDQRRGDTLDEILQSSHREPCLAWLRQQRLALEHDGCLLVHAGVLPGWSVATTLALADEVHAALRGRDLSEFLHNMYGSQPDKWLDTLTGVERLRVIVNALTRLRFCAADGTMEFATKAKAGAAPAGFMPWFDVPGRATAHDTIAFGHWSTLGWLARDDLLSLDSGCVWGGSLSALRWHRDPTQRELIQLPCDAPASAASED